MIGLTITFVVLLVLGLAGYWDFQRFMRQRRAVAETFLSAPTRFGDVQYLDIGAKEHPAILFSTGGGAGIDLVHMLDWLVEKGFRVIAVNRPGYYDLPIEVADSIEEHAAIYKAVVDYLDIDEVHVFGVSMGALSALYYAQNYRVRSMVLWCPLTGQYQPNQAALDSAFGKLFLSPSFQDVISWLLRRTADWAPSLLLHSLIQAEAELDKPAIKRIVQSILDDGPTQRRAFQFLHSLGPMSQIYPGMMDELEKSAQPQPFDWSAIDMPVQAFASKIDKDVSQDHFVRLEEALVNGRCSYVDVAGHFVWWGPEGAHVEAETLAFFKQHR